MPARAAIRAAIRIVISSLICLALMGRPAFAQAVDGDRRPATSAERATLLSLYVSFATLQGLDAHSTLRAPQFGGREGNPVLGTVVGSPAAVVAAKAGATAGVVFASERLWKRHKVAAIILMVALNSTYGAIVAHNYAIEAAAGRARR
jgi:hypothetical protein